jgi:hypothetical protein
MATIPLFDILQKSASELNISPRYECITIYNLRTAK